MSSVVERTTPVNPDAGYGSLVTGGLGLKRGTDDWRRFHEANSVHLAPTTDEDARMRRWHRDQWCP